MKPAIVKVLLLGGVSTIVDAAPKTIPVEAFQAPSPDVVATNQLKLKRQNQLGNDPVLKRTGTSNITGLAHLIHRGSSYTTEVKLGNQTFELFVDTGSSNTWVVKTGFQCMTNNRRTLPARECPYPRTFNGTFSGGELPDRYMYSSYGSGDFISGKIGYERVTVGNISVDSQKIGLVTTSGVAKERISYSGILGLAYPALTHAFVGNESDRRNASAKIVDEKYDPVFTSMWKTGQVAPMFSIALNRGYGSNNGILALGGLADVPIQGEFAKTRIIKYKTSNQTTEPVYYLISPEAFSFGPSKESLTTLTTTSGSSIVIDSGATLSYLPRQLLDAVVASFTPPGRYYSGDDIYVVPCNATAPLFGVQFGGKQLWFDPKDLVDPSFGTDGRLCATGFQNGDAMPEYILGMSFLSNVLAVFDVGAGEMRFAQRTPY